MPGRVGRNISPWGNTFLICALICAILLLFVFLSFRKLEKDYFGVILLNKHTEKSVRAYRKMRGIMCIIGALVAAGYATLIFLGDLGKIHLPMNEDGGATLPGGWILIIVWAAVFVILRFVILKKKAESEMH